MIAISAAGLLVWGGCAQGGESLEHSLGGTGPVHVARQGYFDLIDARIIAVKDEGATYADPPKVTLEILEVLDGNPRVDRRAAVWGPPPHDVDYGDVRTNPDYLAWAATPFKGPPVGSRWLLAGWRAQPGEPFRISVVGQWHWSPENRKLLDYGMQQAEGAQRQRKAFEAHTPAAWGARMQAFRAERSEDDIARAALSADVIVVGRKFHYTEFRQDPPRQTICFQVQQILKDLPPGSTAYPLSLVNADFPPAVGDLLSPEDRDFIVFLKLAGVRRSETHGPAYDEFDFAAVAAADGLVEADSAALAIVRQTLAGNWVPASEGSEWAGPAMAVVAAGLAGLCLVIVRKGLVPRP